MNTDNPTGFRYVKGWRDESPPVGTYLQAASTTLNPGDPVKFTAGFLTLALTSEPVLGVVMGPAAVDDNVYNYADGPIVAGAGETPEVMIILAFADVVFAVQDGSATPATQALIGVSCDMVSATGAIEIDTAVVTNGDVMVWAVAGQDNIAGNEFGANCDFDVTFQIRYMG
jgi:hypothetical protein